MKFVVGAQGLVLNTHTKYLSNPSETDLVRLDVMGVYVGQGFWLILKWHQYPTLVKSVTVRFLNVRGSV